jgi:tetratricopeptide (TPR) repeat protein
MAYVRLNYREDGEYVLRLVHADDLCRQDLLRKVICALDLGHFDEATGDLALLRSKHPDAIPESEVYLLEAKARGDAFKLEQSLRPLTGILAPQVARSRVNSTLLQSYAKLGRLEDGIAFGLAYERDLDVIGMRDLGYMLLRSSNFAEASRIISHGLDDLPESDALRLELLMRQRKWNEAEPLARRLVEEAPTWPHPRLALAYCLVRRGKLGEAEKMLITLRELAPNVRGAHLILALVYLAKGRFPSAFNCIISYRRSRRASLR